MLVRKIGISALLTILVSGVSAIANSASAAVWPAHVAQAQSYVNNIQADNNSFSSPPFLYYDASKTLRAQTKCSSFVALLLKNTYSGVVTDESLIALTGSSSPYADELFTAIQAQTADAKSKLAFKRRTTIASLQPGDLITSSYLTSGNTGHAMVLGSLGLAEANVVPPYPIPGVATVNRYLAKVYDSTQSIHGNYFSNANPDSRYNKQWNGSSWVADDGLGFGYIALYEDAVTGKPVAWAWTTSKTTKAFYYAVTPPPGSTLEYRPLAIGYLSGL